jgi:hypothetical protein
VTAHDYHFSEEWLIPAPADEVWQVLADGKLLPEWWQGVYLKAEPLGDYPEPHVGNQYRAQARGWLPYRLNFLLETVALTRPTLVAVKIVGDLTGTWTATLTEGPGGTRVALEQHTLASRPFIRFLSPVLKPIFAWNHRWTTPRGEAGLCAYLDRQGKLRRPAG